MSDGSIDNYLKSGSTPNDILSASTPILLKEFKIKEDGSVGWLSTGRIHVRQA